MLSREEFQSYVDSGFNIIPVVEDLLLENQTPLTIYSQISDKSNTFLLESVEGGEKWIALLRCPTCTTRFASLLKQDFSS